MSAGALKYRIIKSVYTNIEWEGNLQQYRT